MSFQQPAGWGQRATITDPSAAHQMRLLNTGGNHTVVACSCGGRLGRLQVGDDVHAIYATHHTATDGAA